MLCFGTFMMAASVIPMSMQGTEPSTTLDLACMSTAYLIFLGFVIALSALFSKTWRLNKLMNSAVAMRRIKVEAVDVIWPFVILMTVNIAMLLGWTFVSPHRYQRVENNDYDTFGRNASSYGRCKSENNTYLFFLIPMVLIDFAGLLVATYQCYAARNFSTELSESSYLAISAASLLETLFLGGPILFVVLDNPTAFYLVGTAVLCVGCMTIILPVFVPKFLQGNEGGRTSQSTRPSSYLSARPSQAQTTRPSSYGSAHTSRVQGRFSSAASGHTLTAASAHTIGAASGQTSGAASGPTFGADYDQENMSSQLVDGTSIANDDWKDEWGKMQVYRY